MATNDDSADTWKFKCGQYDWGEWWEGTKQQLQAANIGLGVSFPGEPGAPKKLVHTIDTRGVKVDIQSRAYSAPHGVFWATSSYVERQRSAQYSEEGPVEYAPGVILIRGLYGTDEFRGTGPALVACGLIEDSQLPGRPGRGKVCCTYTPNGSLRTKGCSSSQTPGMKQVMRRGANRYVIEVQVSEEEKKRRERQRELYDARIAKEDAEGRRKREALTGPAPGKEEHAQEVREDPGVNVEKKLVSECSAVFAVGDQVLANGVVAEITAGYGLRSFSSENGEYLSFDGKKISYQPGYVCRLTTGDEFFFCAHQLQRRYDKSRVSYLRLVRQQQSESQARSV